MVDLEVSRVDLVNEGADDNAHIKYYKDKKGGSSMTFKDIIAKLRPEDRAVIEDEIAKAACGTGASEEGKQDVEKEMDPAEDKKAEESEPEDEKKEDVAKESTEEDMEDVFKSLDPRIKAMFDAANAKATAAEAIAKSLVEKELENEAVAKAKEVAGIGASEEQLVKIYKSLKAKDESLCEEVFGIFKSAANVKDAGEEMFDTVAKGRSNDDTAAGSAWDKIMAEATEIAKSKGISEASAVSEVVKAKPDLYREYLKELKK